VLGPRHPPGQHMTKFRLTSDGAKRIEAAHERYVTALRELNAIRCEKPRCGDRLDFDALVGDARRRADAALADWVTLYQHETGRKLARFC
jgi:hypothetical protein